MNVEICFKNCLVDGDDMRTFNDIIGLNQKQFRQRKQYDEYYFDSFDFDITFGELKELVNNWKIELENDCLVIWNN